MGNTGRSIRLLAGLAVVVLASHPVAYLAQWAARPASAPAVAPAPLVAVPAADDRPRLDDPPFLPILVHEDVRRLEETAARLRPATFLLCHRDQSSSGTAFVLSREHRLLATAAHVVDGFRDAGDIVAQPDGLRATYAVERVWLHPDYRRAREEGVVARTKKGRVEMKEGLSPDVAVLRLSPAGPDPAAECRLARGDELAGLESRPMAHLGYSRGFPTLGERNWANLKFGAIGFWTGLSPVWDESRLWWRLATSSPGAPGDSGGPMFLADGSVVAVDVWGHFRWRPGDQRWDEIAAGVRVDALREVLVHHGLDGLVEGGSGL